MHKGNRKTVKVTVCAALMSAALTMGGCTPSGNLISKEKPKVDYVTPTPTPEATVTLSPSPSPVPSVTPTPSGSLTPTAVPANLPILVTGTPAGQTAYYTTANVNVRSEASVNSAILGGIAANTKIDVQEIIDGKWARFDYNGKTGYIHTKYLISEELYDSSNNNVNPEPSSEPDRNQDNGEQYSSYDDDDYEYSGGGQSSGDGQDGGSSDHGDGDTPGSGNEGADGGSSDGGAGDGGSSEGGDEGGSSEGSGDEGGSSEGGSDEGGGDEGGSGEGGDDGGAGDGNETFDEE